VKVGEIRKVRAENTKIDSQINELTDSSIEMSNTYIREMVPKLVDEKTRESVSALERQVILGANINTTSNYQLKFLFAQLEGDINKKTAFFSMTSALQENVEKDIKNLAGTKFEGLAKSSKENLLKVRDLTINYVKNVESEKPVQQAIFDGTEACIRDLKTIQNNNNAELFSRISNYFGSMLITILFASLIGISMGFLTVRSVSKALRGLSAVWPKHPMRSLRLPPSCPRSASSC